MLYEQTYGKNHKRAELLKDLIYEDMAAIVDQQNMPEEAKREMIFKMTVNSLLDMVMDASNVEDGVELMYGLDLFMGVAITNRKFNVDLFKEMR